jgi:tetratricopeptide (TPR) repeat protein
MDVLVEDMMLQADRLFDAGEYAEGRQVLEEILEMEPDYGRAHNHIGWLHYYKLDNFDKAEYHYKLAIKFSPKYPATWINFGYFLNYMGRFADIKMHAEKALKVQGVNKSIVYNQLGNAYEMNAFYKEALGYYSQANLKALNKNDFETAQENIKRVKSKTSFFSKLKLLFI